MAVDLDDVSGVAGKTINVPGALLDDRPDLIEASVFVILTGMKKPGEAAEEKEEQQEPQPAVLSRLAHRRIDDHELDGLQKTVTT
jgi:hypothetical protein